MASITERALAFKGSRQVRGRHRTRRPGITINFRRTISDSLFRNSAFLTLNIVLGAACGYGALSLLTRLYPVKAIGLAAAALSSSGFIASITQFGANYTLPRFLPETKNRPALINTVVTATMLTSFLGAAVFLALPVATKLYALGGVGFAVIFLLYTGFDAGESQLENIFIADRASHKMIGAMIAGNLVKLAAPVACISLGMSGAFVAQCLSVIAIFTILALLLFKHGDTVRPMLSIEATRDLRRYSASAYIGTQLGGLPLMILPLIILSRFGASSNAFWYTSMAIASLLYQLPGSVARALLSEAAHRPVELRALIRRASALIGVVMTPVLMVAYFAAPLGLAFFGHRYVVGSLGPLRWLIIAGALSCVSYVAGTVLYIAKKTFIITAINGITTALILGFAATLAHDTTGIAICWVIGEIANIVLCGIFAVHSLCQLEASLGESQ
jgi:O-antigen/teichoic acid export membrane protein